MCIRGGRLGSVVSYGSGRRGFAARVGALRPLFVLEPKAAALMFEVVLAEHRRLANRRPPELVFTRTGTTSGAGYDSRTCKRALG